MIRKKRTTYAACIGMANPLAIQSTIPRLAAPVRVDAVLFSCDTDYHGTNRRLEYAARNAHNRNQRTAESR